MERIIVPIDFSEESMKGLDLAIIYANKFFCDIQMVHVQSKKHGRLQIYFENQYNSIVENFEELITEYKPKLNSVSRLTYIIKNGSVHEEVVNQANAFDDSMIICSTNGTSGLSDYILGSNAYRIIQSTTKPVISVYSDKYIGDVKRIVLPLDITKETREKVPLVATIAKAFGAEVHIVKVATSDSEGIKNKLEIYAATVRKYFDQEGVNYQTSYLIGDNITDITIEYAKTVDADLIAIMTEQTTAFSNLILGSYAYQMLNTSPIPVLSVTPKNIFLAGYRVTGGN
ncbi:MAG: universal stress protein [Bacteroidales bacterium]|nr:universal stress protein [Bacteroidales bacterium]